MACRILESYILWSWYQSNCYQWDQEKSSLQSIDPFNDIASFADSLSEGNPGNIVQLSDDLREVYVNELDENESEDDEDTEWDLEDNSCNV